MTAAASPVRNGKAAAGPHVFRTVVLGDSRVFDTYYATSAYAGRTYGYHQTFPHVLQRRLASAGRDGLDYDCVHIPDHFRGRTVENNILRLALTDPDCVVLCDGIWESLVSRKHVAEYAERLVAGGGKSPEYSDRLATELFLAGKLSLSPGTYAERVGRIVSWFRRRRRGVVWLTTPVPPIGHMGGLHYAGDYRPFEGWHECLKALNAATGAVAGRMGGLVLDMQQLMDEFGGASAALIDQWHFSAPFHARIAEALDAMICEMEPVAADCVSRKVIVPGPVEKLAAGLYGSADEKLTFRMRAPHIEVVAESDATRLNRMPPLPVWIVASEHAFEKDSVATILTLSEPQPVVLFPEELTTMDNPAVADRSAFGSFR